MSPKAARMEGAVIPVSTYTSLEGVAGEAEVVDGVAYFVVTDTAADGSYRKSYFLRHEGRDFYQADIVEIYSAENILTSRMVIDEYDPDPSSYFNLNNLTAINTYDSTEAMEFLESLGI